MRNPNKSHSFPIYSLIIIHNTSIRICASESSYHLNDPSNKKYKQMSFDLHTKFGTLKCERVYFAAPARYVLLDYKMLKFKI